MEDFCDPAKLFKLLADGITLVFLAVILSYYFLLFYRPRQTKAEKSFESLSVIIPAHNEEKYIGLCIGAVQEAQFKGFKEIIVVDDGSSDRTADIVSQIPGVKLISTAHTGKAASVNLAIAQAQGQLIATIDGDTEITGNTFIELQKTLEQENVVGTTCPILVKNRTKHLLMWLHIEQVYSALLRSIMAKVNANIVNSGQCAMYRANELKSCGGFSTIGYADDMDISIRLIRRGYHLAFTESTSAYTNMPEQLSWLISQRARWSRGPLTCIRRHLSLNNKLIDVYTLPLLIFTYVQGLVMGSFTIYQIATGYYTYFLSKGQWLNFAVAKFFLDWCSILGLLKWSAGFFSGETALTPINILGALSSLLCYPLYIFAIIKYDRKIDIFHIIPLLFMAPFWWAITLVQTSCLGEVFNKERLNKWTKANQTFNAELSAAKTEAECQP